MHCHLIQAGDLQAVVGDAARDGVGGPQYCGLWSLTSRQRPFNVFGNSYAGLIPGELRGRAPVLEAVDDTAAVLRRDADDERPSTACARYRVVAPHTIEHELTLRDEADLRAPGCDAREVSWCSYIDSPDDPRLHLRAEGGWRRFLSPVHGWHSHIAPAAVPDAELETWPVPPEPGGDVIPRAPDRPFHWHRAPIRFDEPFYYGRLGDMVLLFVFTQPAWLRFFASPSGGGGARQPGRTCPAWDFEWVIPAGDYEVGRDYTFRMRLIYQPFESDDEVLSQVAAARAALGD